MAEAAHTQLTPHWTLGDRLRKARTLAGLGSTAQMARRLHVHRNSVLGYESDRVQAPLDIVVRYSRLSGIPLEWFVEDFGDGEEEAVTIGYPTRAPVRVLQLAA
jgi:transcriptional regulator with XRE-family HTH domain